MSFDWSVSVGNIVTAVVFLTSTLLGMWRMSVSITQKAAVFEALLREHAVTLMAHASRMEKQDDLLLKIMGEVQRLIGRMETSHTFEIQAAATAAAKVLEDAARLAEAKIERVANRADAAAAAAAAAAAKVTP